MVSRSLRKGRLLVLFPTIAGISWHFLTFLLPLSKATFFVWYQFQGHGASKKGKEDSVFAKVSGVEFFCCNWLFGAISFGVLVAANKKTQNSNTGTKKCTSSDNWKRQEKAPKPFSSEISMHLSALLCPYGHYHLSAHCEQRIVMGPGKRDATYRKEKKKKPTERKRKENALPFLCLSIHHKSFPSEFLPIYNQPVNLPSSTTHKAFPDSLSKKQGVFF